MISHTWLEKWKKREGIGRRKKISENAKAERVFVCKMCLVGLVGDGRGLGKCEGGKRQHRRTATVFGVGISYIFFASFAFLNALVLLDYKGEIRWVWDWDPIQRRKNMLMIVA